MLTMVGLTGLAAGASYIVLRTAEHPGALEELVDTVVLVGSIVAVVVPVKALLAGAGLGEPATAAALAVAGFVLGYPLALFLQIREESHTGESLQDV